MTEENKQFLGDPSSGDDLASGPIISMNSPAEIEPGGPGDDDIVGDTNANILHGNGGDDLLVGDAGNDTLLGGDGADTLIGDGLPAVEPGVGFGSGNIVKPSGAGNNSRVTAIDVTNTFSLANDANIIDSTTTPHVTVKATGDGNRDYYKLNVAAGATLTFDIDATSGVDTLIRLYDENGLVIAGNDDSEPTDGAGGSTGPLDSYLAYMVTEGGTYTIEIGSYVEGSTENGPVAAGAAYTLQISAAGAAAIGGGVGDDLLDGGAGADFLVGGAGNDLYVVDNVRDVVVESAGQGTDRVAARVDYVLRSGVHVEALTTTAVAGAAAIDLTGNTLRQTITGNAGNNILHDGGPGVADTLRGQGGNDTYRIFNSGDVIVETSTQGTADRVMAAVDYRLGAGVHVEIMTTNGSTGTAAIDLTGNEFAQAITGNAGDNRLEGKGGADTLRGLAGKDTFVFATALSASNVDTITDFNVADDTIQLQKAVFASLIPDPLHISRFRANTTGEAQDINDFIIYDKDDGRLYYDADATGAGARIHFATLTGAPAITNADFVVF